MKSITLGLCLLMLSGCFIPTSSAAMLSAPPMTTGILIQPTKWPPIQHGLYAMTDPPTLVVWPDRTEEERFEDAPSTSPALE